jgi:GABA permease
MAANTDRRLLSRALLVLASLAAVLTAAALATALVLEPPSLAWIGFAILSLTVFALGAAATLVVPRLRVSPLVPAVADDRGRRLLVVADALCSPPALADAIVGRDLDDVAVHLVVPVRVSHLHFLTDDESRERRQAEFSLARTLRLLHERGVVATGAVGDDKPLESMTDALGSFAATHVLLAIPPERESYWLEHELLPKARALAAVEVGQVVVAAALPAESSASHV